MGRPILVLLMILTVGGCHRSEHESGKGEVENTSYSKPEVVSPRQQLLGIWRIILDPKIADIVTIDWEFTRTELIVRSGETGDVISRSNYLLDLSEDPLHITLSIDDSLAEDGSDQRLGIFRFSADELHICVEISEGGERPSDFTEGTITRFRRPYPEL